MNNDVDYSTTPAEEAALASIGAGKSPTKREIAILDRRIERLRKALLLRAERSRRPPSTNRFIKKVVSTDCYL